nr:hypothetical protein [uncultured Arsenicibacter sp.]
MRYFQRFLGAVLLFVLFQHFQRLLPAAADDLCAVLPASVYTLSGERQKGSQFQGEK